MFKRKLAALEYHHPDSFNIDGKLFDFGEMWDKNYHKVILELCVIFCTKLYFSVFVPAEEECRNLVVWLEDQKIRFYKIEDREALRDVKNENWTKSLTKVSTTSSTINIHKIALLKLEGRVVGWFLTS